MRLMKIVVAAALPVATFTVVGPAAHAAFMHPPTSATLLPAPTYTSTLVGPGLASMYPVDVTQNASYYFVLDAGRYRVVAVNRSTGAISCQVGGHQGSGPGQFGDARALDFDTATNQLYVADTPNNRVEVFAFSATACAAGSSTGLTFVSQFGSKGSGNEQFSQVYGIAVDAVNGWVYAVDGAGRVEKSNLAGTYISQFSAGGTLNEPRQVTVAPNSDVLVMNARNHECDVFSDTGKLLFTFGSQGVGNGQFTDDPRGVSVSQNGNLVFVTDSGGKRVEAFTLVSNGTDYTSAAFAYTIASGTGAQKFTGPRGLTTTADGHLVLTDEWGFGLHEFTFTATSATSTRNLFETGPPVPGVDSPRGVQVAANGQIYVVDYWNQRIEYMNADGTGAASFGFRGNPSQKGAINFAWSAAIQPGTGDIFVANRESNQVEVFSPTGTSILIFGTKGTANGQFHFPQGIAFDPTDGSLLVDDSGNDRIERFTVSAGDASATWAATYGKKGAGGSAAPVGVLNQPTGISVAPDGTIWVADTRDNRIQSLSTGGVWTAFTKTVASTGQKNFHAPWGVTVAPDGSIWVADTGNNRIVSMDTSGNLIFNATAATMGVPAAPMSSVIMPFAIAFSGTTAYVSDIWNNRVLALTA